MEKIILTILFRTPHNIFLIAFLVLSNFIVYSFFVLLPVSHQYCHSLQISLQINVYYLTNILNLFCEKFQPGCIPDTFEGHANSLKQPSYSFSKIIYLILNSEL